MSDENVEIITDEQTEVVEKKFDKLIKLLNPNPNRWIRLFVHILIVLITGCVYWGWNGIQELLYKAGSFEDLCVGETDVSDMIIGGVRYIDCGARKSGINNLYTIAFTAHFTSSIIGGFLLDYLGPRILFIGSQAINLVSWLLITSVPKNGVVLNVCFFLIGLTAESLYIPLITVSTHFPKNASFIITLLGAVRSISMIVPNVLSSIFRLEAFGPGSLYVVGIIYAVFGNLMCGTLGGLLIPSKFDRKAESILEHVAIPEIEAENQPEDEPKNMTVSDLIEMYRSDKKKSTEKEPLVKRPFKDFFVELKAAFNHPQRFEYLIVLVSFSLFITAIGFVNKSQREIFVTTDGQSVVDVYKYFNILSFLPAPFLGMIMDYVGPAVVILILHVSAFLFYLFVAIDSYYTKLMSCVFYVIPVSLVISSIYCYLKKRFSPRRFGVLVGTIFLFGGSLSLTNIPLYDLAVIKLRHLKPSNFTPVLFGLMGYMIVCSIISGSVVYINTKISPKHLEVPTEKIDV